MVCHGSGWQPGPPIPGHHHGKSFDYHTVQPCTHDWRDDDPDRDEYALDRTQPITFAEHYARLCARHARHVPGADIELAAWDRLHAKGGRLLHDA